MSKSPSASPEFSVREFFARFPDDDSCLEHVMRLRHGLKGFCPTCGVETTFHKLKKRRAYTGAACGHHVYPCVDTIFADSRTALQTWFYAIYLFIATRHGVSGKELQRQLGVTYKCAHRMGHQIRDLMAKADGFTALRGHIEIDEVFMGGVKPGNEGRIRGGKTVVLGMKQRGGRIVAGVVPNVKMSTIKPIVLETVEEGSKVSTDELPSYGLLNKYGYDHGAVNHKAKEWVRGEHSTNGIESFWKLFRISVRSTHIHVSATHMNRYVREFTFRSNHRGRVNLMFDLLIASL